MAVSNEQLRSAVIAAKMGNAEAFTYIYENTYKIQYYNALKIMKNEQDAQDILQEAYTKAFSSLNTLEDPAKFSPWLAMIINRMSINALKKKTPQLFSDISSENDEGDVYEYEVADENIANNPEIAYTQQETSEMVNELLGSLSPEQKMAIIMFHIDGLSIKEIAETMNCNENTVKSRLNLGRKNLKAECEVLKKKGYKLYSLSPLALLLCLLRLERETVVVPASLKSGVSLGLMANTSNAVETGAGNGIISGNANVTGTSSGIVGNSANVANTGASNGIIGSSANAANAGASNGIIGSSANAANAGASNGIVGSSANVANAGASNGIVSSSENALEIGSKGSQGVKSSLAKKIAIVAGLVTVAAAVTIAIILNKKSDKTEPDNNVASVEESAEESVDNSEIEIAVSESEEVEESEPVDVIEELDAEYNVFWNTVYQAGMDMDSACIEYATNFHNDRAWVMVRDDYGCSDIDLLIMIDNKGEAVTSIEIPKNLHITSFDGIDFVYMEDESWQLHMDDKCLIIDKDGNEVCDAYEIARKRVDELYGDSATDFEIYRASYNIDGNANFISGAVCVPFLVSVNDSEGNRLEYIGSINSDGSIRHDFDLLLTQGDRGTDLVNTIYGYVRGSMNIVFLNYEEGEKTKYDIYEPYTDYSRHVELELSDSVDYLEDDVNVYFSMYGVVVLNPYHIGYTNSFEINNIYVKKALGESICFEVENGDVRYSNGYIVDKLNTEEKIADVYDLDGNKVGEVLEQKDISEVVSDGEVQLYIADLGWNCYCIPKDYVVNENYISNMIDGKIANDLYLIEYVEKYTSYGLQYINAEGEDAFPKSK